MSVRYPASWKTEESSQEGVWYRYFQGPAAGSDHKAGLSATLLVASHSGPLDQYAQSYLAGKAAPAVEEASRQGVGGRRWRFASTDGTERFSLLLLQEGGRVTGLYLQGTAADFERQRRTLDEIEKSLTLEWPESWTERRAEGQQLTLRIPASWPPGQSFATGGTYFMQFISPALAIDKGQTVHASLTASVEPAPAGPLDGYYQAARARLGEGYKVLAHVPWRGGYVDMMRTETPISVARVKRYLWSRGSRGYTLSCEAREDVFPRVTRWCDAIASTLQIEGQPLPPLEAASPPAPAASPRAIPTR